MARLCHGAPGALSTMLARPHRECQHPTRRAATGLPTRTIGRSADGRSGWSLGLDAQRPTHGTDPRPTIDRVRSATYHSPTYRTIMRHSPPACGFVRNNVQMDRVALNRRGADSALRARSSMGPRRPRKVSLSQKGDLRVAIAYSPVTALATSRSCRHAQRVRTTCGGNPYAPRDSSDSVAFIGKRGQSVPGLASRPNCDPRNLGCRHDKKPTVVDNARRSRRPPPTSGRRPGRCVPR
jgi:hypothetical protein